MGKVEFPAIVVGFTIHDESGNVVHRGQYRLDDDTERRAAGQRFHEAMRAGFEVRTRRIYMRSSLGLAAQEAGRAYYENLRKGGAA